MEISKSLMDDMFDSSVDIGAAVENARKQLSDISLGQTHIWMDANELAANTITYLEQNNSGKIKTVKTGLEALDRMIGGLYPGELTYCWRKARHRQNGGWYADGNQCRKERPQGCGHEP